MKFEEIQKAIKVFSEHGISSEDMQKQFQQKIDRSYWDGFDAAIDMVLNVVANSDARSDDREIIHYEIIENAQLYKKDG